MADPISAPGTLETSAQYIRQVVNQERDVAAIAKPEEDKKTDFEGIGPKDPDRGNVLDIET